MSLQDRMVTYWTLQLKERKRLYNKSIKHLKDDTSEEHNKLCLSSPEEHKFLILQRLKNINSDFLSIISSEKFLKICENSIQFQTEMFVNQKFRQKTQELAQFHAIIINNETLYY